jgi:hypothetical protein
LLAKGGAELLAQNLLMLIDQARPVDWLAAQITGQPTNLPFTLRIHDLGDFHSIPYAHAWFISGVSSAVEIATQNRLKSPG